MRPTAWAKCTSDLRFRPENWGDRVIRLGASGGTQLLVRRHGAPELSLWLPARNSPAPGESFGLFLHPDRSHSDRIRAASLFRRAIGIGPPVRVVPFQHAHRHAAMLCLHDLAQNGASLRDIAGMLLDPMPADWRASSERSDLRRLLDAAAEMTAGGYRRLLGAPPAS